MGADLWIDIRNVPRLEVPVAAPTIKQRPPAIDADSQGVRRTYIKHVSGV